MEEIRDIRDKAKYAPTQAEYKVYIIDEVICYQQARSMHFKKPWKNRHKMLFLS